MLIAIILFVGVVLVSAIMNGVLYKRLYNKSATAIERQRRRYALEHPEVFGVSNHGSSLDDRCDTIYSLSSKELGLWCGNK